MPTVDLTPTEWDDEALDRLTTITPEDLAGAAALWREGVEPPMDELLDALRASAASDASRSPAES